MSDRHNKQSSSSSSTKKVVTYDAQKVIGQGSFGAVFLARIVETDEVVAIKKVLQDNKFKNRELEIMRKLKKQPHPYVVFMRHYFSSKMSDSDKIYLNLVLEYVPETLHSVNRQYTKRKELMPPLFVKIYTYQMFRALAHIHGMGITHRDIKPQNLLVDPATHTLKLCDFGSAKELVAGEPNVAYISSRFYRAPELIIGGNEYIPYTSAIDIWSAGCVFAELLLGNTIFPGISAADQLIEIVKILGTPSDEELDIINVAKCPIKIPQFTACPLNTLFKYASPEVIDLVIHTLTFVPAVRITAIEAMISPAFDELRRSSTVLPDGSSLSESMWQFTDEELSTASPNVIAKLYPVYERSSEPVDTVTTLMKAVNIDGQSGISTADCSTNS